MDNLEIRTLFLRRISRATTTFLMFFFPSNLDLLPSDSITPTLHLVAYSVNQKGRSEPTVLEDIAINEAEKRTGEDSFL